MRRLIAQTSASRITLVSEGKKKYVLKEGPNARHEAEMLALARGRGVVDLVDANARSITLEYVPGPTLAERMPIRNPSSLAKKLVAIVTRLHAAGIVHADLKPENVILRGEEPVLVDFETARRIGEPYDSRITVGYVSRERFAPGAVADPKHDAFSLGAVLWASIRGASPFDADTRDAMMLRVLATDPEPLSGGMGRRIRALLAGELGDVKREDVAFVVRGGDARGPFGALASAMARVGDYSLANVAFHLQSPLDLAGEPAELVRRGTSAFLRFMRKRDELAIARESDLDPQSAHAIRTWREMHPDAKIVQLEDAPVVSIPFARMETPLARAHWAWREAVRAIEGSDLDRAKTLLDEADAQCALADGSAARLQKGLIDVLRAQHSRWTGDHASAKRLATEALARLPSGSHAWCEALGERATASGKLGDTNDLVAVASALREPSNHPSWDRACSRTCVQLYYQGRTKEARALERLFRARTDEERRALSPGPIVVGALFRGRLDEYLDALTQGMRGFLRAGDVKSACLYGASVGFAHAELGDYARAERSLRAMLERARRSGLETLVTLAKHNLGFVLASRGKPKEAIEVESEAIAVFEKQGDKRFLAGSLVYRARAHLLLGDLDRATKDAFDADAVGSASILVHAVRAEIACANEAWAGALDHATKACTLADGSGLVESGDALARLCRIRALAGLGKSSEAQSEAKRAWRRIEARALRIADARHRARFLNKIPEHRATRSMTG